MFRALVADSISSLYDEIKMRDGMQRCSRSVFEIHSVGYYSADKLVQFASGLVPCMTVNNMDLQREKVRNSSTLNFSKMVETLGRPNRCTRNDSTSYYSPSFRLRFLLE